MVVRPALAARRDADRLTPERDDRRRGEVDEPAGVITRFRRGVIAGFSIPLLALIMLAVPVMVAWIVPGSDSVSATSALRAAAIAVLSGMHGGVMLGGELTTLPPMAVTVLLGWLACGPARRLDSVSGFAGLTVGFTASCLALARWAALGQTYAPVERSGVAGTLFMLLVGGAARWSPTLWARLTSRLRRIVIATGGVITVYIAAGAFTVAGQLALHNSDVTAVQAKVAPGAGGLAILLLGFGAAANAVVAAIGYLTGFGFDVGTATSVSVRSVARGPVPDFPLLAALPREDGLSIAGLILLAVSALLAGLVAVTMVQPARRGWRGLADLTSVAALTGLGLGALGGCARGGVGGGALRDVGVVVWQLSAGSAGCVLAGSAIVAVTLWSRRAWNGFKANAAPSLVARTLDGVQTSAVVSVDRASADESDTEESRAAAGGAADIEESGEDEAGVDGPSVEEPHVAVGKSGGDELAGDDAEVDEPSADSTVAANIGDHRLTG